MFNPKSHRDSHFHIPRQCFWLKLNGSWPLKSTPIHDEQGEYIGAGKSAFWASPFSCFYTCWSWYVIASVGITIYFQSLFLVNNFGNIAMTTENCCTTFMGALNFVRLLHLRLNQTKFKELLQQFVDDIWIVKNSWPQVERKCQKNMNTFRVMTILLSCLILMYCILPFVEMFVFDGINKPEKPFPYKMQFPYDAHHGWRYVVTYLFTSYAGLCVVTTLFAEDSLFGFFVTYTCGQFEILHERIDALIPEAHKSVTERIGALNARSRHFEAEYTRRLNHIAYRHNKLIQFAIHLEHFFNPILLVNFVISSILICMVGFQLVTGKDMFIGDYMKFMVYIFSSLSQLFILCWNGDRLIQDSTETAKHLYACNWEGDLLMKTGQQLVNDRNMPHGMSICQTGKNFRVNLQIMILCSQRPVRITALKFSTLSLQSFTAILSTSMSYFTLLQTLYYENQ